MALIKCPECGKKISDEADKCIHCGYPIKEKIIKEEKKEIIEEIPKNVSKERKDKSKKSNLITTGIVLGIIIIIVVIILVIPKENTSSNSNQEICKNQVNMLQKYIDNKDTDGFDDNWFNHESYQTTDDCSNIKCNCPEAWKLFTKNKLIRAELKLEQGLVSSAYDTIQNYIEDDQELQEFHDNNNIFKIISSKEKEKITGIYHSFGEWNWEYKVGGSFKFNKRYVDYGSSSLSLKFDDYSDKVLISGHLEPSKHKNWNKEKTISVNWYNYKILNNKILIKLENESDSQYDSIFEIKKLTDTSLSLKLLLNLDDVKAGQVYNFTYKRT